MLRELQVAESLSAREDHPVRRAFRRSWWLLLALTTAGSIAGWYVGGTAETFAAQATVTAVKTPLEVEDTDLASALFSTDSVLEPVADELDLAVPARSLLTRGLLDAEDIQGGAVEITGRADTEGEAIALANAAARSFVRTLEDKGLGTFEVFLARDATARQPRIVAAVAGAIAGLLGAQALVFLYLFVRRPILGIGDALSEQLPDALLTARWNRSLNIRLGRRGRRRVRRPAVSPQGIMRVLGEEIEKAGGRGDALACFVVVGGTRWHRRRERALLADMDVEHHWESDGGNESGRRYWVRATDKGMVAACDQADVVVFVVLDWTPRTRLKRTVEDVALASSNKRTVLFLIFSAGGGSSQPQALVSASRSAEGWTTPRPHPRLLESSQRPAKST